MVFCHSWGNQGSAVFSLTVRGATLYSMARSKQPSQPRTGLGRPIVSNMSLRKSIYAILILATSFHAGPDKSHPV
jgi:hypothetical protein